MEDSLRDRLGVLLEQALALPREDRSHFLEGACSDETDLRDELASLLSAFESSTGYFEDVAEQIVAPALAAAGARTVAHYEILERIADSGMGIVYKARDLRLGRAVALKFLPPQLIGDNSARERLNAEARAASALDHPNIAVIHEIGETAAGELFIAMAWQEGDTLKDRLRGSLLPVPDALVFARQIAGALCAAHEAGIIHRDVKPSNIMVTSRGVAKLLDFGIAKVAGAELTRDGATLGTIAYMSPEQTRAEPIDPRTDIWSLGVVLYEMLTGQRPFRGETDDTVIFAIRHDEPTPIAQLRPETPRELCDIVGSCLAKERAARYTQAAQLLADLEAVEAGTFAYRGEPAAHDAGGRVVGRWPFRFRHRRLRVAALAGAAVLLATSGYLITARSARVALNPQRVVVVPFVNRTGDASLDPIGSMAADWIIQGLSHTDLMDVVPMTAALMSTRFVSSSPGGADPTARIQLLARETGAAIVVAGAFYRQRDSLYLRATVTDAVRDRVLHAVEPIATTNDQPLAAIAELRQRLMGVLALHVDARTRAYADRPGLEPPSFDVYQAYADGMDRFIARDWRSAIARFGEAIARDPTFTPALVLAAIAHAGSGNFAAVDSMLAVARPQLHRMHQGDRLTFDYLEALARGDRAAAYRAELRAPEIAPGGLAHWGLANAALWVNRPREAVRVSRQLDPERGELRGWYSYWRDLTRAHHRLGEYRDELRAGRRGRELFPDESSAAWPEVRALAALGRESALLALLEQMQASPWLLRRAGLELLVHGSDAAANRLLRESLDRHRALSSDDAGSRLFLAHAYALVGELDDAERLLRALTAERPNALELQGALGSLAARRGDVAEAARISGWLAALDRPYLHGRNTFWRARIASVSGNPEEGVRLLHQAIREGLDAWDDMHTEPDFAPLRDNPAFRELMRPRG